jgi:uncharacterized protein (TIGR03437 family)
MTAALLTVRPGLAQTVTTVAGDGSPGFSGDGGLATSAQVDTVYGVAADMQGNLYVADTRNHRVRKIANGIITTVAGTGQEGSSAAGALATATMLSFPRGVAVDPHGNLHIADTGNSRILKVASNDTVSIVAGTGVAGFSGDGGPAASAQLSYPEGLAFDLTGNLYIADSWNYRIRKIDSSGTIRTIVGNGSYGPFGDGGSALDASLGVIQSLAVDPLGNVYLSDPYNHLVRKVSTVGTISTVVGGGFGSATDGGTALTATLKFPKGIALDAEGNLYLADSLNHRVGMISPAGIITTLAGSGVQGYSGDGGAATAAQLNNPYSLGVDWHGSLLISDLWNYRVRSVTARPSCGGGCAVTSAASYSANAVAPGGIVALWGNNLASGTVTAPNSFPLPMSLGGTSVTFNGILAPLFFVSPRQVNAQVPFELAPGAAVAEVASATGITTIPVTIQALGPGIFTMNRQGTGDGAILDAQTFRQITPASPALPGEWIQIYGTGLGAVQQTVTTGDVPPSPPPQTNTKVDVLIDGVPLAADWAGLAPGWVGLYAVNVQLPANIAAGSHRIQLSMGAALSNTATIPVASR